MRRAFLILTMLSVLLIGVLSVAPPAFADSKDAVCSGIGLAGQNGKCEQDVGSPTVDSLVSTIIGILSYVVGVVAVIMIILGAFKYITSSGDAAKVTSAKNTIMYALIGVVVAALAQVLVHFVFIKATTPTPVTPTPPASVGKS